MYSDLFITVVSKGSGYQMLKPGTKRRRTHSEMENVRDADDLKEVLLRESEEQVQKL